MNIKHWKKLTKKTVFLLLSFMLVISTIPIAHTSGTAAAQAASQAQDTVKCDQQFYSSNDILFYNPCEETCAATQNKAMATINSLRGANNAEKIFNFWVDSGLTTQQAAGITGSMKHEGGFSPFRQEMSQTWEAGGWGIAQFTFIPGQRGAVKDYLIKNLGADLFNQYYKNQYGGAVVESKGFVPDGIPQDVNDKFLLGQLNYLLEHIKGLKPNNVRRDGIARDFNQIVNDNISLYDYLKTLVQAPDAAVAWTYLYEFPGDIKNTSNVRADSARQIFDLYNKGTSTSCGGGLSAGGMTLEQAKQFMEKYKSGSDSLNYVGGAALDCVGGPLANCVSFSAYFVNKYTNLKGFQKGQGAPGIGSTFVKNAIARNPDAQNGTSPRPYALFSAEIGSMMCGNVLCGHTGAVLGVDTARGKVIIGEAACGRDMAWVTAREYDLNEFSSGTYIYIYTDGLLKGTVE